MAQSTFDNGQVMAGRTRREQKLVAQGSADNEQPQQLATEAVDDGQPQQSARSQATNSMITDMLADIDNCLWDRMAESSMTDLTPSRMQATSTTGKTAPTHQGYSAVVCGINRGTHREVREAPTWQI